MKHLAKLKKRPKYAFWNLVFSDSIQEICQRIDRAYALFFRNKKHGLNTGTPGFKKVKKYTSFTFKNKGWKFLPGNKIRLRGRIYKYAKSREIIGTTKTITVKRNQLNDLYLLIVTKQEFVPTHARGNSRVCGFDFGLKTFLVSSNGSDIHSPLFFKQAQHDVKLANRTLSRKKKGSKARKRANRHLTRVYQRVANRRRDYHFKLAHQLTNTYDALIFETLNIAAMKRLWGKKVSDLSFSSFLNILSSIGETKGNTIHFLDRWQPTTKPCSVCGFMNHQLTLKDRTWECPQCGSQHDRDKNAAINIERQGVVALGLGDIRPAQQAIAA